MKLYIKGHDGTGTFLIENGINKIFFFDDITSNQSEWMSLIKTMEYISGNLQDEDNIFEIDMDSLLLFRQLIGEYRIKSKKLKPLYFIWNRLKNEMYDKKFFYEFVSGFCNPARCYLENA
jgi:ribonuclease HI